MLIHIPCSPPLYDLSNLISSIFVKDEVGLIVNGTVNGTGEPIVELYVFTKHYWPWKNAKILFYSPNGREYGRKLI